jgi:hypothetical protein
MCGFFFVLFCFWVCSLNSGLCTCKAGAPPLEPHLQSNVYGFLSPCSWCEPRSDHLLDFWPQDRFVLVSSSVNWNMQSTHFKGYWRILWVITYKALEKLLVLSDDYRCLSLLSLPVITPLSAYSHCNRISGYLVDQCRIAFLKQRPSIPLLSFLISPGKVITREWKFSVFVGP